MLDKTLPHTQKNPYLATQVVERNELLAQLQLGCPKSRVACMHDSD
jgi:hypothetical protein